MPTTDPHFPYPPMADGTYLVVVHPSFMDAFRLTPKERWKMRHREQRMRAKGYPEREINPPIETRVGTWQGFRFIEESDGQ